MSRTHHYTALAKFLHWLVAGGIVLQYILAELAENAEHAERRVAQLGLLANHKSVGMTVLMLAILRVIWRTANRAPALPTSMPRWQIGASHVSHILLYMLIFLVPLTGWLMSSASAYSVSWFNLFQFPDLIGSNAEAKESLKAVHELFANLLFVVAIVHVAAACKHALLDRDGVMSRITSTAALGLFATTLAAGLLLLARTGPTHAVTPGKPAGDGAAQAGNDAGVEEPAAPTTLPAWRVDADASRISFTADQAGAEFTGHWPEFTARLHFDADRLDEARFSVSVDTRSPSTNDEERDTTLIGAEWFDSANYPGAFYKASEFEKTEDGFVAKGSLTIKNNVVATPLTFTVSVDGARRVLDGRATLDRLALGLGTGDWSDTTWVGQNVVVDVHIEATATP